MKHINRIITMILTFAVALIIFLSAACAPGNMAVFAQTPEPTAAATAAPAPTPTPEPTPEPTPVPRVIEFGIEQTLVENTTGVEIAFHHLTYTKNQGMVLTLTVSNHTDKYLYLVCPIYANVNGYGILFTTEDKYETWVRSTPNSETEVSLSVKLDQTMDSLMSIEQIKSAQFDCVFVFMGEAFREISDEFINPDCPADYVQSYNMQGDKAILYINPEYYTIGISNDIQISSIYSDVQKKVYLTIAGTTLRGNITRGDVADHGRVFLAIDGVVTPYDDDIYTQNGEEIYLPNNGYCVVSFDVSHVPDFNYQTSSLSCSVDMENDLGFHTFGYFSALLRAGNSTVSNDFTNYSDQGDIWIDEKDFQFIYQGIGYDEGGNTFFDGNLINKTQSKTIAYKVDIFANGKGISFISDPVPPNCVVQMHSIQYDGSNSSLYGVDIAITVYIVEVGALGLSKTTKTIQLVEE